MWTLSFFVLLVFLALFLVWGTLTPIQAPKSKGNSKTVKDGAIAANIDSPNQLRAPGISLAPPMQDIPGALIFTGPVDSS
jgi:hypothetical protein